MKTHGNSRILTATRTGEVIGAKWSEIDTETATWLIPAERMESWAAASDAAERARNDAIEAGSATSGRRRRWLYLRGCESQQATLMALLAALGRMGRSDLTIHGFRSTFRDWAAEATAYPNHVVELALAYTIGDKVEATYRRGDLFEKRRALMDEWASSVTRLPRRYQPSQVRADPSGRDHICWSHPFPSVLISGVRGACSSLCLFPSCNPGG